MARIPKTKIRQLLQLCDESEDTNEKGDALESLTCVIFEKIPGIECTARDVTDVFTSSEVDVVFWNDQNRQQLYFLPNLIFVECKNHSTSVGSSDVRSFDSKLRSRGLEIGILVALNDVAGNPDRGTSVHHVVAQSLGTGIKILILTREDILSFGDTRDVIRTLKQKLCDLHVQARN